MLLLLLLMGAASPSESSTTCFDAITECSDITMSLSQAMTSISQGDGEGAMNFKELCDSAVQNMTECVTNGQSLCQGQPQMVTSLQSLLDSVTTSLCSTDNICMVLSVACQANITKAAAASSFNSSMEDMNKMCKLYPGAVSCLDDLDSECQSVSIVQTTKQSMSSSASYCSAIVGDGSGPSCYDIASTCSQILMGLSEGMQAGGDVASLCAATIQNMTACVQSAVEPCSGQQEMLDGLQQQLTTTKNQFCSTGSMCSMKAVSCSSEISTVTGSANETSMETMLLVCPLYPNILKCLKAIDGDCQNDLSMQYILSSFEIANTACGLLTNDGSCMVAISCYSAFMIPEGPEPSCSLITDYLTCLSGKVGGGSCTLNESLISIARVRDLMSEMCPVADQQCEAAESCMIPEDLPKDMPSSPLSEGGNTTGGSNPNPNPDPNSGMPVTGPPSPSGVDPSSGAVFTARVTDPVFFCRFLATAAKCYVDHKSTCSYDPQYVGDMEDRHHRLMKECNGLQVEDEEETTTETSGVDATGVAPGVFCMAVALFGATWTSIFQRS